jgi:putative oxidoreductase
MTVSVDILAPYTAYLALILRVVLGGAFILHGYPKLGPQKVQVRGWMKSMGMPGVLGTLAGTLEFFGGIFLIVGLIVPVVAALYAIFMASIIVMKVTKMKAKFVDPQGPSYELDLLYLLLSVVMLSIGSGYLSLDSLVGV